MALEKVGRFVLTDESLDRHSQRVIASGMDLKAFRKNPVILYNHLRTQPSFFGGSPTEHNLPIGTWKNIIQRENRIEADAWIDMADEKAAAIGRKIKDGIIKAASIAFKVLAVSDAQEDKVKGQKGLTVTKAEAVEASIVDIPANPNALRFKSLTGQKSAGTEIELDEPSEYVSTAYCEMDEPDNNNTQTNNDMAQPKNVIEWAKSFFKDEAPEDENQLAEFLEKKLTAEPENEGQDSDGDTGTEEAGQLNEEAVEAMVAKAVTDAIQKSDKQIRALAEQVTELAKAFASMAENIEEQEGQEAEEEDETALKLKALTEEITRLKGVRSGGQSKKDAAPAVKKASESGGDGQEEKKDNLKIAGSVDELLELVNGI